MLFNSFDFGLFFVIAYGIYWGIGSRQRVAQNAFLLLASYFFYALWDWRFLGLLIASSLVDYYAGKTIERSKSISKRKLILWISISWNLGVLILFKYFNFFLDGFYELFHLNDTVSYRLWNVAIPLGLSFYTFQTLGYTLDVYRQKLKPSKNILDFLCFVSFFPQLVAGPIEKAKSLLPQFHHPRKFDLQKSKDGLRQILWGLFKKIIVAEKLGLAVNMAFEHPEDYHFITLAYAVVLFCFQVYCDFSGYTDIALGSAKLLGFDLSRNFRLPYVSKSMSELWQRWHITLTRWFTENVYQPLLGHTRNSTFRKSLALLITMTLIGLWHGARWTYIAFGLFSAFVMIIERIPLFPNRRSLRQKLSKAPILVSMSYAFFGFLILGILFRAETIEQAGFILKRIFTFSMDGQFTSLISWKVTYLIVMLLAELLYRKKDFPLQNLELSLPKPLRWVLYYALIIIIIRYAEPKEAFIYFQF